MNGTRRSSDEVELARLLNRVDPSSRSAAKFQEVQSWLARRFGMEPVDVVCKSLVDDKNVRNRIEEALRQSPRVVVFVDHGTSLQVAEILRDRLKRVDVPPVALRCIRDDRGWLVADIVCQADGDMQGGRAFPNAHVTTFIKAAERPPIVPRPALSDKVCIARLEKALSGMEVEAGNRSTKHEELRDTLASIFGIQPDLVVCKALAESKNFGNRIGEGLGLAPALLVLLTPDGTAADVKRVLEQQLRARDLKTGIAILEPNQRKGWWWSEYVTYAGDPLVEHIERLLPDTTISERDGQQIAEDRESDDDGAACTYCKRSLQDGIRGANGTMKSCPGCSMANGQYHVFHPFPQEFGTTLRRISEKNRDGAQSYCSNCRRGNIPRSGTECPDVPRSSRTGRISSSRDWRNWSLDTWKDRLFDHYFVILGGNRAPVDRIDVSPLTFKKIVSDEDADANEAIDAFIAAVRRDVGRGTFHAAVTYVQDWFPLNTGTLDRPSEPPFLPHLIFSCLVAAGYGPQSDGSYQVRIQAALGNENRGQNLSFLSETWKELQVWLERRATDFGDYRKLILPRESWRVNIGYSIDLAFPNRRDRQRLSDLLFRPDLEGTEPPLRKTLGSVQENIRLFTEEFRQHFRHLLDKVERDAADVDMDPVWRVIAQAASRRLREEDTGEEDERIIVAELGDEELILAVATTDTARPPEGMMLHDPELAFERFGRYLAYEDVQPYRGVERLIVDVFAGKVPLPSAAGFIKQGVLPFVESDGRLLVLARGSEVASARYALVHEGRREAFVSAYGGELYESQLEDWYEVHDCRIEIQDELPDGLEDVWCLARSVIPTRITVRGGIPVGTSYLIYPGRMPVVGIPGADAAYTVLADGSEVEMQVESGYFAVPPNLGPGSIEIRGERHDGSVIATRRLTLWATTPTTEYKAPSPKRAYWFEAPGKDYEEHGRGGELPLLVSEKGNAPPEMTRWTTPVYFLGPRVGDLSNQPIDGFDWMAYRNTAGWVLQFQGDRNRPTLPKDGLGPKNAVREYRRLFRTAGLASDADRDIFECYRTHVRQTLKNNAMERFDGAWKAPSSLQSPLVRRTSDPGVIALEYALAALAYNQTGIPTQEVLNLFEQGLGITKTEYRWAIFRAWIEAGIFDLARDASWSNSRVFIRRPRFVAYRIGTEFHGSLIGLATAPVRNRLEYHAPKMGFTIDLRYGPSEYLSPISAIQGGDWDTLVRLSNALELAEPEVLRWPDNGSLPDWLDISGTRLQQAVHDSPLPSNYRQRYRPRPFSPPGMQEATHSSGITTQAFFRHDRPPFHVVQQDGKVIGWAHFPNWAWLRACMASGTIPFRLRGTTISRVPGMAVCLPLGVGRLCAILGPQMSGPDDDGTYRYTLPTPALASALARSSPLIAEDVTLGGSRRG